MNGYADSLCYRSDSTFSVSCPGPERQSNHSKSFRSVAAMRRELRGGGKSRWIDRIEQNMSIWSNRMVERGDHRGISKPNIEAEHVP